MREFVQIDAMARQILLGEPGDVVARAAAITPDAPIGLAGGVAGGVHPVLEILPLEAMPALASERRMQRLGGKSQRHDPARADGLAVDRDILPDAAPIQILK